MKIIAGSIRAAMCLYGYMGCRDAEIIFASPKINPAILGDATPCMEDLNKLFQEEGYYLKARIIANDEFHSLVLQPILRNCSCGHIRCSRCSSGLRLL